MILLGFLGSALALGTNNRENSKVSVSVDHSCNAGLSEFKVPGGGVVQYGEVNYFEWEVGNRGSIDTNISATLNVTYEAFNPWSPGERVGVKNYTYKNSSNYTVHNITFQPDQIYTEKRQKGPIVLPNTTYVDESNETVFTFDTILEQWIPEESLEEGWYSARTNVTYRCYDIENDPTTGKLVRDKDEIITGKISDFNNFRLVNSSGGVSDKGNQTTNSTVFANTSIVGDFETNQTLPQDVNRSGEESNQTIEGDNQNPGQTPVPEPTPILSLDIEPKKNELSTRRGQPVTATMEITNVGNEPLADLTISPEISEIREGWTSSDASIANLTVNETVERDVIVSPPQDEDPGTYSVPVVGSNPDRDLDVDYFTVELTEEPTFKPDLSIIEAPRSLTVNQNETIPIPLLLENSGGTTLTNMSAEIQNLGDCGKYESGKVRRLGVNETGSLPLNLTAGQTTEQCETTILVSSDEEAYAFTETKITVTPEEGLIPQRFQIPLVASIWTLLLAAFAVLRRRYKIESGILKIPFVLLLAGEALIFVYLISSYYGLISAGFLPF